MTQVNLNRIHTAHRWLGTSEFANELLRRFELEEAESELVWRQRPTDENDEDFNHDMHFYNGRRYALQRCIDILLELMDAEIETHKTATAQGTNE
jgi:hypothetical protein